MTPSQQLKCYMKIKQSDFMETTPFPSFWRDPVFFFSRNLRIAKINPFFPRVINMNMLYPNNFQPKLVHFLQKYIIPS